MAERNADKITRRGVFKGLIVSTLAVALKNILPIQTVAAEAEPRFMWENPQTGFPEVKGNTLVTTTFRVRDGYKRVAVAGPFRYLGSNGVAVNFEGQGKGDDNATVAIIVGSHGAAEINAEVWPGANFTAEIKAKVDDKNEDTQDLIRFMNETVRDPRNRNGKNNNGVSGRVEFVVIDGPVNAVAAYGEVDKSGNLNIKYPLPTQLQPTKPVSPASPVIVSQPVPGESQVFSLKPGQQYDALPGDVIVGDVQVYESGNWVPLNRDGSGNQGLITVPTRSIRIGAPYGASGLRGVAEVNRASQLEMIQADMFLKGCKRGCERIDVRYYP